MDAEARSEWFTVVRNLAQLSYYRLQAKLRKGNVFTPVCNSVHSWGRCTVTGPPGALLFDVKPEVALK